MNVIIQGQLDRVEAALNTLISSIESYNPSVPAAIDLLAADTELQNGVKQLAKHQFHHAHILRLRSALEAQDARRKSTLILLADTRKDLLSTPATTFPEPSRNVPYTELLDYAKRISRYTIPPTLREPSSQTKSDPIASTIADTAPLENGVGDAVTEARETNAIANGEVLQDGESKGVGEKSLEPADVQWLNPLAQAQFTPWPTEDIIKRGALGQIQVMLEQGFDHGASDAAGHGAEGGKGRAEGDDAQMGERAGEVSREISEGRVEGTERRAEGQREEKPKVFKGLDLDEDSDDE